MPRFLTQEGVELFLALVEHNVGRFDIITAKAKTSRFLREWYGDVAFEEYP